jgi:hypothetical protein
LFSKIPDNQLIEKMADYLWAVPAKKQPLEILQKNTDHSSRAARLQTAMVQLMATPEYQLC